MISINTTVILQIITVTVIGIIAFFIKRELKKLEDADRENKNRIEALENEIYKRLEAFKVDCNKCTVESIRMMSDFRDEISKEYVKKEDYFQTASDINKKLDKIYDMLYELNKTKGG